MRATAIAVLLAALGLYSSAGVGATVSTMIGDDDGFGGRYCSGNCSGGELMFTPQTISNAFTGTADKLADGLNSDAAATDKRSSGIGGPYLLEFNFATNLATVTSATVTLQVGSLGYRADGSGFGYAQVYIDKDNSHTNTAGDAALGNLFTLAGFTVPQQSSEEQVRLLTFDVKNFITTGTNGFLRFLIDGSTTKKDQTVLDGQFDVFAFDFARLDIEGTPLGSSPVPLPPAAWLMVSALVATGFGARRGSHTR